MRFTLDVTDPATAIATAIDHGAQRAFIVDPPPNPNAATIAIVIDDDGSSHGSGLGDPVETAYTIVNAIYGPENAHRDSNEFYVFGPDGPPV